MWQTLNRMKISASFAGMKIFISFQVRLHLICRAKGFRSKMRHLKILKVRSLCSSDRRSTTLGRARWVRRLDQHSCRGIAMARAEECVSSKQQQHQMPTGIFLEAVISLESIQEQNWSGVGSSVIDLHVNILYEKPRTTPHLVPRNRHD